MRKRYWFVFKFLLGIAAPVALFFILKFATANERLYLEKGTLIQCQVVEILTVDSKDQVWVNYEDANGNVVKAKAVLNKKVHCGDWVEAYVLPYQPKEVYYPPSLFLKIFLYAILGGLCLLAWAPFALAIVEKHMDKKNGVY